MKKEFDIKDILDAVNNISKLDKKKTKNIEKKDIANDDGVLTPDIQSKFDKSEILVLDQMIE